MAFSHFQLPNDPNEPFAIQKKNCRTTFLTRLTVALDWKKDSAMTNKAFQTLYKKKEGNRIHRTFLSAPESMTDNTHLNYKMFTPLNSRRNTYPTATRCFFDAILAECHATLYEDGTIYRVYGVNNLMDSPPNINIDCTNFGRSFSQLGSDYIDSFLLQYETAHSQLLHAIQNSPQSPLASTGHIILNKISAAQQQKLISFRNLPTVTNYMQSTAAVIQEQTQENIARYTTAVNHMMGLNAQWVRGIASAMVTVLGLATVIASIALGLITGGASTPLTIAGINLGTNMLVTSATLSGTGLLGAGLSYFAGRTAIKAKNGELATLGQDLLSIAKQHVKKHK